MGQEIGVTPIQLTAVVSAIANGGLLYRPRIVQEVRRAENAAPPALPALVGEPKRVIRPETAATLRRLMEGVILDGTGKLARLDGWTAAGKTGSAQKIDPVTGRYSPTQFIASFTGFAPINSPAVTILISLDSPVGLREGGQVAAPVFKRIAEQVLAYLDVPRDVPRASRMMQASYRGQTSAEEGALTDLTPADFSAQPEAAPLESNYRAEAKPQTHAVTVAVDEGGDVSVPALRGKTMREVTRECLRLGLDPALIGTGVATDQSPEAGSRLRRGNKIVIRFGTRPAVDGREAAKSPVASGKGR